MTNPILKTASITAKQKCILLLAREEFKDTGFRKEEIRGFFKEGREAIDRAIRSLVQDGFLIQDTVRDDGRFVGTWYWINEERMPK